MKMKVTGHKLHEAINTWELRRDAIGSTFTGSLHVFPEQKGKVATPAEVASRFEAADRNIATLQTAQLQLNFSVKVDLVGQKISLAEAVKRYGGAARLEAMWKGVIKPKKDRYTYATGAPTERNKDMIVAEQAITHDEAVKHATTAARVTAALRAAISSGNSTEIELDLDGALFE